MSIRFVWTGVVLTLLLMWSAGCDAVRSEDDGAVTRFELAVSGELDTVLRGNALFAEALNDDDRVFLIQLQSETDSPYVLVSIESLQPERTAVGEYRVVGSKSAVINPLRDVIVVFTRSQSDPFLFDPFTATGGTLTISHSSSGRIDGHIEFDAVGQNGRTIHVIGTIQAIPGH